mmetsp:Transcript_5045/g.15301  ORF Transcript_5045/g.15301 Transcript_5045/m.15301 type:complete len:219 (-) Transcript_5045:647-1303(-)
MASLGSSLIFGLFLMFFARLAYLRVESVSSKFMSAGPTLAIMRVLVFPPKESCSIRVSLESLYGMCPPFPSTRALITFPNALSERLILVASLSRSPVAPVLDCRSDPARSTKFSFPTLMVDADSLFSIPGDAWPCGVVMVELSIVIMKMAWLLEESWFISVSPTVLFLLPTVITLRISFTPLTTKAVRPLTYTPFSGFSFSSSLFCGFLESKSLISSL